jgi:murein L,D-transpeptidase YcbB/YkuD
MSQFKLRQDPGKWNALGAIKFVFPNRYNVYMHDTPAQLLFQRSSRAFSHGCIRLSNPVQLAVLLLSETGKWPEERLREVIATGKRTIINLPEPLPVHITYQTVKSDQNGRISFHADIYNRDEPLEKILFKKEETKQTSAKGNKNDLQVDTQDVFRVQRNNSSLKRP